MYIPQTPAVEVYDSEGYIQFSNLSEYPDPVRKRFGSTLRHELGGHGFAFLSDERYKGLTKGEVTA